MRVSTTALAPVLLIEPKVFVDERGYVLEAFQKQAFERATGARVDFVLDLRTGSARGVLRGIHYQLPRPQAKLVSVTAGEVFDVVVDLRRSSPDFGRWTSTVLSADNRLQVWVPEGFGHGFLVLSNGAEIAYKLTDQYCAGSQCAIRWDDPEIGISWPLLAGARPHLSPRDESAPMLRDARVFER